MKRQAQTISGILLTAGFIFRAICSRSQRPILALLAVLLHEGGHWYATKLCHVPLKGFLFDSFEARLFLGETISYKREIVICAAGPFANLLSLFILPLASVSLFESSDVSFFVTVSVALAVLNLLPIGDLDGGRIFSCFVCLFFSPRIAHYLCDALSFITLFCLWSMSVYALLRTGGSLSLFFFSATLFFRVFMGVPSRGNGSIQKNKRE